MPLFNCQAFVYQAVKSILDQSYRDFEFLIIDDGSDDSGPEIVTAIKDERIVFLRNPSNIGVAATLNRGLAVARGKYVVRMDADDISLPDRLQRQVQFMDDHPEVGISGAWVRCFGTGVSCTIRPPCEPEELRCFALFENPFCHMAVIMRREMMQTHNLLYDTTFSRSEDYELWSRALHCFPLANIGKVLVKARQHPASVTLSKWQEMATQTEAIQAGLLSFLGITPDPDKQSLHHQVGRGYRQQEIATLQEAERWLLYLCRCNKATGFAHDPVFASVAGRIWLRFCINSAPLGTIVWSQWQNSPLREHYAAPWPDMSRLVGSIIWHRLRPRWIPDFLSAGEAKRRKEHLG